MPAEKNIQKITMAFVNWVRDLFGLKTPQERLREYRHEVDHTVREVNREIQNMNRMSRNLTADLERAGATQELELARLKARNIVRIKRQILKLSMVVSRLQDISINTQVIGSQIVVTSSIQKITSLLRNVDEAMSLAKFNKIATEFQRQSDIMQIKEETVDDTMDAAFDEDGTEDDQTEELVNKMLVGIGLTTESEMPTISQKVQVATSKSDEKSDKQAVLHKENTTTTTSTSSKSDSPVKSGVDNTNSKANSYSSSTAAPPPSPIKCTDPVRSLNERFQNLKKNNQ